MVRIFGDFLSMNLVEQMSAASCSRLTLVVLRNTWDIHFDAKMSTATLSGLIFIIFVMMFRDFLDVHIDAQMSAEPGSSFYGTAGQQHEEINLIGKTAAS